MDKERRVINLNIDDILPNRFQPRIRFDESAITELSESIKEHGVIQPIVVRPIADKYEIIAGERRYKASVMAGKKYIPAIVTDLDDKESAEVALIENVQRQDLTPIEEAVSYKKILDMGYLTQNQLADKLGKTQSTVANKLRLLNLDDDVQEALLNEKISERHARSLLKISQKDQRELLNRIINKRLTVRKTDEEVNKILGISSKKISEEPVMKEQNIFNDETEILDLDDDIIEPVNNNFSSVFESPIIDDDTQDINPGFLDINSIEANATDINTPKPEVDFDNLLEPSDVPMMPEKETPEEDFAPIRPGKFFQMFDNGEEVLEDTNKENFDSSFGFNENPSFDEVKEPEFNFNDDVEEEITPVEIDKIDENIPDTNDDKSLFGDIEPDYAALENNDQVFSVSPEEVPSFNTQATDLMSLVQKLRDCADLIEQNGYEVEMDEFDFENMYQVIIKIGKQK